MALPDDDRRALAARLATTAAGAVDVVAVAVDDGEELREVLVDIDGDVVALTGRRALFVAAGGSAALSFDYGAIEVRRRETGLGIDALIEGAALVLDVARATFVRLGVIAQGSPPGRATWLPTRTPVPKPPVPTPPPVGLVPPPRSTPDNVPPAPTRPGNYATAIPGSTLPPPGWHPDPSGRHWWRWWDGRGWTDHVADGGAPYLDALPPR